MTDAERGSAGTAPAREGPGSVVGRRRLLGLLDQGLVSAGTLAVLVAGLGALAPGEQDSLALGLSLVAVVTSITRSLSGDALLASSVHRTTRNVTGMFSLSTLAGLVACAGAGLAYAALRDPATGLAVAVGVALVQLQDSQRYVAVAENRDGWLFGLDLVCVVLQVGLVLVTARTVGSGAWCVVAYGVGAGIAALLGSVRFPVLPAVAPAREWLRASWSLGSAYVAEAAVGAVVGYVTLVVLDLVARDGDVAVFRLAMSLFGVVSVVTNYLRTFVLRGLSERPPASLRDAARPVAAMAGTVTAGVVVTAGVALLLPDGVTGPLFGAAWPTLMTVLGFVVLNRLLAGWSTIPTVLLRVLGVGWDAARLRLAVVVTSLAFGPVGAVVDGVRGAVVADSLTFLLLTVLLGALAARRLRAARPSP